MFSVTRFLLSVGLSSVGYTRTGHPYKFAKAYCSTSCRSQFFNQRIVNVWNSLPHTVDFTSLTSFKKTINDVDYSDFLKVFFHFNFIIQYWLFIFALSYYTMLLFVIWAVVSAAAACLILGTYVLLFTYCFFCIFWHCSVLCFQNKLMMMMISSSSV